MSCYNFLYANLFFLLPVEACTVSQFECSNGACIDIGLRCNDDFDCDDMSDELGCKYNCTGIWYSETCLNRISLGPTFVFGIDRFLVYTG